MQKAIPDEGVALGYGNGGLVALDGESLEPASDFFETRQATSGASAVAVSDDDSLVALGATDGIFVWSPSGQQLLAQAFPTGLPQLEHVIPLDENRLRTAPDPSNPTQPVVWDVREPSPEPVPLAPVHYYPDISSVDGQGQDRVLGMTFFALDQLVQGEVWDKQTLTDTGVRLEFPAAIVAVDLERGVLIGAGFTDLFVFDADTGEIMEQREGFVTPGWEAYFNPDKTRLITFDQQENATLWDTETWEHVKDWRGSDGNGLNGGRFAPSGELVTVDPAGTIVVWDPETLEPLGSPMFGAPGAFWLGFSTDGSRLFSVGAETILWDFATRTRISDAFPPMYLWPGPDAGERGVSGPLVDGENILIWNLNPNEWYDIACRAAGRNMTRAEWEEIGPRDAEYQATCPQFPLEP